MKHVDFVRLNTSLASRLLLSSAGRCKGINPILAAIPSTFPDCPIISQEKQKIDLQFEKEAVMRFMVFSLLMLLVAVANNSCGGSSGSPGSTGTQDIPAVISASVFPGTGVSGWRGSCGHSVDCIATIPDCDGKTETVDPEPFTDHMAELTIIAAPASPDITDEIVYIERYTIEFFPQDPGSPPIDSFSGVFQTLPVKVDSSELRVPVILVDIARKMKFQADLNSGMFFSPSTHPMYDAKYTFYGKDQRGHDFSFVAQTFFFIGDYNGCTGCQSEVQQP